MCAHRSINRAVEKYKSHKIRQNNQNKSKIHSYDF